MTVWVAEKDVDGDVIERRPAGGTDVLERPKMKAKPKLARPKMFNCIMLNDDYTPMDFVVHLLQKVFHKSEQDAALIMMEVHKKGLAICGGPYTYEVAETKVLESLQLARMSEHPLQVVIEPCPDA